MKDIVEFVKHIRLQTKYGHQPNDTYCASYMAHFHFFNWIIWL